MVENVDAPKGFLVVSEAPWTGKCGNHKNSGFYGKIPEFSDSPLFYIKILKTFDFPLFGVQGASKTTENPLGISTFSATGAKIPPIYKKDVNLINFH